MWQRVLEVGEGVQRVLEVGGGGMCNVFWRGGGCATCFGSFFFGGGGYLQHVLRVVVEGGGVAPVVEDFLSTRDTPTCGGAGTVF